MEHLGGIDFDEALFQYVLEIVGPRAQDLDQDDPATAVALARLRRDCVEAKEALSTDTDTLIAVNLPGFSTALRITRAELESMIRPAINDTVAALARSVSSAHLGPDDLSAIALVGGSSRIPLVGELLHQAFPHTATAMDTHPKHDVALGAIRAVQPQIADPVPAPTPAAIPAPSRTPRASGRRPRTPLIEDRSSPARSSAPPAPPSAPARTPVTAAASGSKVSTGVVVVRTGPTTPESRRPSPAPSSSNDSPRRLIIIAASVLVAVALIIWLAVSWPDGENGASTDPSPPAPTPSATLPPRYVFDTFDREVVNGFGKANTGGGWTIAGVKKNRKNVSVRSGAGRLRLDAKMRRTVAIGRPRTDTDVVAVISFNKAAAGGSTFTCVIGRWISETDAYGVDMILDEAQDGAAGQASDPQIRIGVRDSTARGSASG